VTWARPVPAATEVCRPHAAHSHRYRRASTHAFPPPHAAQANPSGHRDAALIAFAAVVPGIVGCFNLIYGIAAVANAHMLCGHHYRVSRDALAAAGATAHCLPGRAGLAPGPAPPR
jgi:hypothetical protein